MTSESTSGFDPEPFPARRCVDCGSLFGHPPAACRSCGGESLETIELSGRGRLYASTVIRVPGADNQGEEPYRVGIVDVGGRDEDVVRVTAQVESDVDLDLDPETAVGFVGKREGTFVFRPA